MLARASFAFSSDPNYMQLGKVHTVQSSLSSEQVDFVFAMYQPCGLKALEELLYFIRREHYNPRFYQNYTEEDMLGMLKPLSIQSIFATPRKFEKTVLRRYFLRLVSDRPSQLQQHLRLRAWVASAQVEPDGI